MKFRNGNVSQIEKFDRDRPGIYNEIVLLRFSSIATRVPCSSSIYSFHGWIKQVSSASDSRALIKPDAIVAKARRNIPNALKGEEIKLRVNIFRTKNMKWKRVVNKRK